MSSIQIIANVTVNGQGYSFMPENMLIYDNPICQYERTVDGTLTCTHFVTKKIITIEDWMNPDQFSSLLAIVSSVEPIQFISVTIQGLSVVTSNAIDVYVIHPIEYRETGGIYSFRLRMEEV